MMPIIEIKNLTKHYQQVKAVNGLSFTIPAGICFGLLGPNGAGKTTTIEMIEGITQPSGGEILYKGIAGNPNFKLEAGIQFQSTALMDYLSVQEVLELFGSFYPNPLSVETLSQQCHLSEFLQQQATKLSGGQKQRVLLALALINDPDILFLDEPTTGLDPQSRRNFWQLIEDIKQRGKTVLLTTHYMDEAEQLCDELVIVDRGKIIAQGTPHALLKEHFEYVLVCLKKEDLPVHLQQYYGSTPSSHDSSKHTLSNGRLTIKSTSVEKTLQKLIDQGASLNSLQVHNPTLEDLFLKLTGHSLRE